LIVCSIFDDPEIGVLELFEAGWQIGRNSDTLPRYRPQAKEFL
jgi:hypothetical protein